MRTFILILAFCTLGCSTFAQVVNTEELRLSTTNSNWQGNVDVSFSLNRTKAGQTLNWGINGRVQYQKNQHKWMLLGGYSLVQFTNVDEPDAVPKNFTNFQYTHLRYNYDFKSKLTWEAFVQEQWDEIHEIDIRLLFGTGPRLELLQTDTSQIYVGVLYMYEVEQESPEDLLIQNRDHRLSSYFSLGFKFSNFTLDFITYYQPNLTAWNDYRINSKTVINTQLSQRLSLQTSFNFIFDAQPPATVRKTRYNLKTGLGYNF